MTRRGNTVFTGKMQLLSGWEIRPFAVQVSQGAYAAGLSAREHRAGNGETKTITLDTLWKNKEEALHMALEHGLKRLSGNDTVPSASSGMETTANTTQVMATV
jgi:hypothetical protein